MHFRNVTFIALAAAALLPGQGVAPTFTAKPARTETRSWTPPRTPDGHPDLQGVWANNNATPLERPKELGSRAFLTDQEVANLRSKAHELFDNGNSDAAFGDSVFLSALQNVNGDKSGFKSVDGGTGDYSSVWLVERNFDNRTSLITDPSDGRLPALTPEAQQRQAAVAAIHARLPEGPEDRSLSERCITFGAPRLGAGYNSYYQIVQSPDFVVLEMETIHDARIIPLDGRPHLPPAVHTWLGDSRGHWEGDTLVVDTTNYKAGAFMNASEKLHVIERFTRTGPDTLKYEVTVDDPATWAKPWTAMIPLSHSHDAVFEYACHEGNLGMTGILAGARAEEKAEAANRESAK